MTTNNSRKEKLRILNLHRNAKLAERLFFSSQVRSSTYEGISIVSEQPLLYTLILWVRAPAAGVWVLVIANES